MDFLVQMEVLAQIDSGDELLKKKRSVPANWRRPGFCGAYGASPADAPTGAFG